MKKRNFINGMIWVLLIFSTPVVESQGNSTGSAIEPSLAADAMEILKGSTRFIEATEAFSVSGHAAGELMMENGQLVEYGTAFKLIFVRPEKLYLSMSTRDGQVWVARGDEPTPRRLLITHRNKPEKPRFWIQFDEWNPSPEITEATFNYLPPEGAERVDYFRN